MILVMSETNGLEVVEIFHIKIKGQSLVYHVKDYYPGQGIIANLQDKKEVYVMAPEGKIWIKKESPKEGQ